MFVYGDMEKKLSNPSLQGRPMKHTHVIFSLVLTIFFIFLATAIMAYISLAVPIGPWIEPTLVLVGTLILSASVRFFSSTAQQKSVLAYAVIGGGIAGIAATACAWSIPALYFLQPTLFAEWLAHPWYFAAIYAALVVSAGGFGLLLARWYERPLLDNQTLVFPIGQMVFQSLNFTQSIAKGWQLLAGAVSAIAFGIMALFRQIIPAKLIVLPAQHIGWFSVSQLVLYPDMIPMLWAIGFIAGHMLAVPFGIGALLKFFAVGPLNHVLFPHVSSETFLLALCAGLVLEGAVGSMWGVGKKCVRSVLRQNGRAFSYRTWLCAATCTRSFLFEGVLVLIAVLALFAWLQLSVLAQLFIVFGTSMCVYELMIFMGKVGLAPLGRFATFVMLPVLVLFGSTPLQATLVAAFVEIAGGVAADAISGKKVGQLATLQTSHVHRTQWASLLGTAVLVGMVFWVLFTHFGVGLTPLVAQKAQARALLIGSYSFDFWVVGLGVVIGYMLKRLHIATSLVLGGLLMPYDVSLILIAGGFFTSFVKDPQSQVPFWSGVFAASSLWMVGRALV